ncbi:MAG: hypothetical protein QW737_04645 [Nitrososphaerota archaeon]
MPLRLGFRVSLLFIAFICIGLVASLFYLYNPYPPEATSSTYTSIATSEMMLVDPSLINFELEIENAEGVKEFRDVALINVEKIDSFLFRPVDVRVDGLSSVSLSGRVMLESHNNSYTVNMPCIHFLNVSCPRVTMIIPGYDAPMTVKPGRYFLSVEFSWSEATGHGHIYLSLAPRAYDASIIYLGSLSPDDTTGWITAEGSTRSYALQVDRTRTAAGGSGYGEFTVHAWVFESAGEEYKKFRFELTSLRTGETEAVMDVTVERHGPYYPALLLVKARPGEYLLRITRPVDLSIKLQVED